MLIDGFYLSAETYIRLERLYSTICVQNPSILEIEVYIRSTHILETPEGIKTCALKHEIVRITESRKPSVRISEKSSYRSC